MAVRSRSYLQKWMEHGSKSPQTRRGLRSVVPELQDPVSSYLCVPLSAVGDSALHPKTVRCLCDPGQQVLLLLHANAGLKGKWKRGFPFISFYFYQKEKIVSRSLLGDFLQTTGSIWLLCFHAPTPKPALQRAMGL